MDSIEKKAKNIIHAIWDFQTSRRKVQNAEHRIEEALQAERDEATKGLWDKYVEEVANMYPAGSSKSDKLPVNFLGSVERHHECFERALKADLK